MRHSLIESLFDILKHQLALVRWCVSDHDGIIKNGQDCPIYVVVFESEVVQIVQAWDWFNHFEC